MLLISVSAPTFFHTREKVKVKMSCIVQQSQPIPSTQTVALVKQLGGELQFDSSFPVPEVKENEVLAKILYTGVCQSGMSTFLHGVLTRAHCLDRSPHQGRYRQRTRRQANPRRQAAPRWRTRRRRPHSRYRPRLLRRPSPRPIRRDSFRKPRLP